MFGFLKNILGHPTRELPSEPGARLATEPVLPKASTPAPKAAPAGAPGSNGSQTGNRRTETSASQGSLELPLQAVLAALPPVLAPRIRKKHVGQLTLSLPLETLLPQLARGAVKMTFGELRHTFPQAFSDEPDRDQLTVMLPLREILARLNPALLASKRPQKQVQIPADISSPFGPNGQTAVPVPDAASPEPARTASAQPFRLPEPPAGGTLPAPAQLAASPTPFRNSSTVAPSPATKPLAAPVPLSIPLAISRPREVVSAPAAAAGGLIPAPQMSNRPGEKVKPADSYIVRLSALAESWSEQLRQEIVRPSLHDAQVALPGEIVDAGVKQGRLACSWRMLRSWISPAPLPAASAQDQVVLELPLNLLAPMFLARKSQSGAARKKVILDERIPNLFFAVPQADQQQAAQAEPGKPKSPAPGEPTGPVTAQPQKPNHFARESALATGSPLPTPGRATQPQNLSPAAAPEVGAPVAAKPATPNEIVSRAAALDGVAGALIALQDGLLVASHVSPELNPETLAAFIPRIFAKLGECAGDLRLGQLNRLEFTVGDVPWRILRLNSILFASFGQAGKSLPSQQLDELAAELTRKPK